jgi:hypothetical protein
MKKIDVIHNQAMEIAQKALLLQRQGNSDDFVKLSKEAFLLEKQAAMFLKDKFDVEPNRSILYKSAAFLAYDAKEYEECSNMIVYALFGEPDNVIKKELLELFLEITNITQVNKLNAVQQVNI